MALYRSANGVPFRIAAANLRIPAGDTDPVDLSDEQVEACRDAIESGMLVPVEDDEVREERSAPKGEKRKPGRPKGMTTGALAGAPETR